MTKSNKRTATDDGLSDARFMDQALDLAKEAALTGEVPVGAVVVDGGGRIVAAAGNECEKRQDATCHAEMLALKQAAKKLGRWRLDDCTLYVTLEPCPMCAGAIYLSRIGRLVYGAPDSRFGAAGSAFHILAQPAMASSIAIRAGVKEESCQNALKNFFQTRRQENAD